MGRLKFAVLAMGVVTGLGAIVSVSFATSPVLVDFDAALTGLGFPPASTDGNGDALTNPNGLIDSAELAVVSAILADDSLDLTSTGGIDHDTVHAAWTQALASATTDLAALTGAFPTAPALMAGYAMLGSNSYAAANGLTTFYGAPMSGNYALAIALDPFLGPAGDADGDGFTNQEEYDTFHPEGGNAAYVAAALDSSVALAVTDISGEGTYAVGMTVSLGVTLANTSGDETFQWQVDTGSGFGNVVNGGTISGATTAELTIDPVNFGDEGDYRVVITNSLGTITSESIDVNVVASLSAAGVAALLGAALSLLACAAFAWTRRTTQRG